MHSTEPQIHDDTKGKDEPARATYTRWRTLLRNLEQSENFKPLRTAQVDGLDIWPIIKSTLVMELLNSDQRARLTLPRASQAAKRAAANSEPQQPPLWNVDVLFLANSAPALRQDGVLLNPHLDPLRHALEKRGSRTLTAYYDASLPIVEAAFPSVGLAAYLHLGRQELTQHAQEELLAASAELQLAFQKEALNTVFQPKDVTKRIAATLKFRSRYTALLEENYWIRFLFLTNYYGPHGWAATAAAKSLGVMTTDVQHGLHGSMNHAYAWSEVSMSSLNTVPERFLTWTDADIANLDRYPITAGKSVLMGPSQFRLEQLMVDKSTARGALTRAVASYKRQVDEVRQLSAEARSHSKKIVGLFLQYKEDIIWLQELRSRVPDTVALWARRHPGVRQANPDPTPIPGLTYIDDYPLPILLREVDLTVTGYSSVGVEAAHAGCPVVAHSPMAKDFLEEACRPTGFVLCEANVASVAEAIMHTAMERKRAAPPLPPMKEVLGKLGLNKRRYLRLRASFSFWSRNRKRRHAAARTATEESEAASSSKSLTGPRSTVSPSRRPQKRSSRSRG